MYLECKRIGFVSASETEIIVANDVFGKKHLVFL